MGGNTDGEEGAFWERYLGATAIQAQNIESPTKENLLKWQKSHDWDMYHQVILNSIIDQKENLNKWHYVSYVKTDEKKKESIIIWQREDQFVLHKWGQ